MSRTFYIAAAAIFASAAGFAQTPTDKPASAPDTTASAPAPADSSTTADGKMHHHHHHHGMRSAKEDTSTDNDADKLNACMANAIPTDQQASCLKQATSG